MQEPLVSIIVPAYNHESYVESCLASILSQDYSNFEVIVIDDGSSDETPEIISQYVQKDSRVTFIRNESNIGLTRTLNKAIREYAKGKYIIQLASDDLFCEGRIISQVNFMEQNPQYGMAYSNAYIIDNNGTVTGQLIPLEKTGWIFDELFLAKFNIPACTCIYKTKIFGAVGYYDEETIIEDSDIWYKISKKYQVGYINMFSAFYRRHETNSSKKHIAMYRATIQRLQKYKDEPNYQQAVKQTNIKGFFIISLVCKKEAIKLLPSVLPYVGSKFLWGGILNIIGLGFIIRKFAKIE